MKYGGGTSVTARLGVDPTAGQVRLTITDGGPGVAPADRKRLFTRYARGGASDDRDGTGLGLYVGRALAQANGGDLVLDLPGSGGPGAAGPPPSAPGPGAAFTLVLPAEAPTEG